MTTNKSKNYRTPKNAKDIFKQVCGERQNISSSIVRYGYAGVFVYELSHGEFMEKDLWGVCVIKDKDFMKDMSRVFTDKETAEEYIRSLRKLIYKN